MGYGILKGGKWGKLLIGWQTRCCVQFWRLQGVDMDPVCVVFDQCACPDCLVILHSRWFMIKANDSHHAFLRKDSNV